MDSPVSQLLITPSFPELRATVINSFETLALTVTENSTGQTIPLTLTSSSNEVTAFAINNATDSALVNMDLPFIQVPTTIYLLHFDGTDGSTTLIDQKGNPSTCYSGTSLSTTSPKFGTAALLSTTPGLSFQITPATGSFDPKDFDWTLEFWAKGATLGDYGINGAFIQQSSGNFSIVGPSESLLAVTLPTASFTNWTHVAYVRHGGDILVFINGNAHYTGTAAIPERAPLAAAGVTQFINYSSGSIRMDELRLRFGEAVYTAPFTPPTAPFTS